jgi:hypothetical protein
MRYGVSTSTDYGSNQVVVRDFNSKPVPGRVLCIIARDNLQEAENIALLISDLLNQNDLDTI